LSLREGQTYRLPTEAEWEFACRAGTTTAFHTGDSINNRQANLNAPDSDDSALNPFDELNPRSPGGRYTNGGISQTRHVGCYAANAFGLYDMHGNVREWCHDWYHEAYHADGAENPNLSATGSAKVSKGGCYSLPDGRSASRWRDPPGRRDRQIGFRVVREVPDPANPAVAPQPAASLSPPLEGLKAGHLWSDNGLAMGFCWCPPGAFTLGSPPDEEGRGRYDRAQAKIEFSRGFWLATHEVTQKEWVQIVGTTPWVSRPTEATNQAVTGVSHWDAARFCDALTEGERLAGRLTSAERYRLPTEAEWEYGCRAGTQARFSFGGDEDQLNEYAWWDGLFTGEVRRTTRWRFAHEVGRKKPNHWGLRDMHGNVWEWCESDQSEMTTPRGKDLQRRFHRGGAWNSSAGECRAASRSSARATATDDNLGFRVARVLDMDVVTTGSDTNDETGDDEDADLDIDRKDAEALHNEIDLLSEPIQVSSLSPDSPPEPGPTAIPAPQAANALVAQQRRSLDDGQAAGDSWTLRTRSREIYEFHWCPPGKFKIGSPAAEQHRRPNENQVEVDLTEGFWIGRTEVSQNDWEQVMRTRP
ncbi:MAG: SUMF1/EgtB/PvdO family nonheme iron enzyme, partial [Pirellulales bacterium]